MAVRDVLLDTNAYVAFKRGTPDAVDVLRHAPRIGMSSIVLGEVLSGFAVGTREAENRQELEQFLASERVHQLVVDVATAAHYAVVYREIRRRGRPIPTNDMWIAATALQHGFAVFSYDGHFPEVPGLHVGHTVGRFSVLRGKTASRMPTSDEDEDEPAWRDRKLCENGAVEFFGQTGS